MYLDLVYASYVLIFAHFIENVRSNNGKTKVPLFAILSIPCQIRENSLIWGSFSWSHDCPDVWIFDVKTCPFFSV